MKQRSPIFDGTWRIAIRVGAANRVKATLFVVFPLFLIACVTPSPDTLREVVHRESVTFDHREELPRELLETLAGRRVILLGETHYVQEHQEFLIQLIRALHPQGLRYLSQESHHAAGWAVDDYVRGERDDYPVQVRPIDRYWIEALREFNRDLPPQDQVRVRYNDMNHDRSVFHYTLQMMARESGTVAIIACPVLVSRPGTPEYEEALTTLHELLRENEERLRRKIISPWFDRLHRSLEIELRSLPIRKRWNDAEREKIMVDLTVETISETRETGATAVFNMGMYHAQKERFMGTRQEWVGEYLTNRPELYGGSDGLYSLAVFGLSGKTLRTFTDREYHPVPPAARRRPRNLARAIADATAPGKISGDPGSAAFLPLAHRVFSRRMPIAFSRSALRAIPARQFDGYVAFREISVLESLRTDLER